MSQPDSRPAHSPTTASRVFSGEAVVVSPGENTLRMFNGVGSRIWELANGERTIDEIAEVLVGEYEVARDVARAGVQRFVDELLDKGLLQLVG